MEELLKMNMFVIVRIALGSLRELDTQLIIAQKVGLTKPELFTNAMNEVEEMQKIMVSTLQKLSR